MTKVEQQRALKVATLAARQAGRLMRENLAVIKRINETTSHDIKLELDVLCQDLIDRLCHRHFPEIALLGEEGDSGNNQSEYRWVVDPIDGTVNYAYGIPHACVSIALQQRLIERPAGARRALNPFGADYETVLGVVYDPFQNELWSATQHEGPKLNGRPIRASQRDELGEAMVAIGFGKTPGVMRISLGLFHSLSQRCRKVRNMGSASLALVYVASGRFDGYLETGISLWDIAAGGFILERAGGVFWREQIGPDHKYRMVATNAVLHAKLKRLFLKPNRTAGTNTRPSRPSH
jgi:myo-inositol-1(or 4)-monophosphatase